MGIFTENVILKHRHTVQAPLPLCLLTLATIICLIVLIRHLHIKNKRQIEVIYFMDTVTRGKNFNKFNIDAENILKFNKNKHYAMVTLDIDKFKYINDVFGFDKGNQILALIYNIISNNILVDEVCCRVSHDIFSMLLIYNDNESLLERLEQINEDICTHVQDTINHKLIINYGIYVIEDNFTDIKLLSDLSHMALKSSKGKFKTYFTFYDNSILESLQEQVEIETSMESSLKNGEFKVYFQPKYDLNTNKVVGAEALIRWHHDTKGVIPPDKFIPLFEKNGFIYNIDKYVFENVCVSIRRWIDNGYNLIPLSVNLSRLHVYNNKFISDYVSILEKYSIPPSLIEIEFTESIAIYSIDILLDTMNKLKEIGFIVSIDDFGAGYSSLNILNDIPADVIKLDRQFLSENFNTPRGQTILSSIASMTKNLNMQIVSEGIETLSQAEYMKNIGCDLAQGYYFDRPMPTEEFELKYIIPKKSC